MATLLNYYPLALVVVGWAVFWVAALWSEAPVAVRLVLLAVARLLP